jgi:hypothetical protein
MNKLFNSIKICTTNSVKVGGRVCENSVLRKISGPKRDEVKGMEGTAQ